MNLDKLYSQMIQYNNNDVPFKGNPQITYFSLIVNSHYQFKRHTNFSYGTISLEPTSINNNNTNFYYEIKTDEFYVLNSFIICIDKIENLSDITISINSISVKLTAEYLKIYNLLSAKTILEFEDKCFITIPMNLNDFFNTNIKNKTTFAYLPMNFVNSLSINLNTINPIVNNELIKIRLQYSCLDTEEVKNIKKFYLSKEIKILPKNLVVESDNNSFTLQSQNYNYIGNSTLSSNSTFLMDTNDNIGILIENFNLVEFIEFVFSDHKITLTNEIINIYDKLYDKIIYRLDNNKTIINIKSVLVGMTVDKYIDEYKYNVNIIYQPNSPLTNNKIYMCNFIRNENCNINIDYKIIYCVFNPKPNSSFGTCFRHFNYPMELIQDNKTIIQDTKMTHLKQLVVYWTKKDDKEPISVASNITLSLPDIDTLSWSITELDSICYQQLHFDNIIPNIYTIGFSLMPKKMLPSGELNIHDKIEITWNIKDDYKQIIYYYDIHIILFGYEKI